MKMGERKSKSEGNVVRMVEVIRCSYWIDLGE
jgi:hypothetical protein